MPITATMTGSWYRTDEIFELLKRSPTGELDATTHATEIEAAERRAITDQLEAGLHQVSNGEQRKNGYTGYLPHRFNGFSKTERSPIDVAPDVLEEMSETNPTLIKIFESGGKLPLTMRLMARFAPKQQRRQMEAMQQVMGLPVVESPLEYTGAEKAKQEASQAAQLAKELGAPSIFIPSPSPGVTTLFYTAKKTAYRDHDEFLFGAAKELAKEYKAILREGVDLQIDAPDLEMGYHLAGGWGPDYEDENFYQGIKTHIEATNEAIEGLPTDRIRLHACYGNYAGPHIYDADFSRILPTLLDANAGTLVLEGANPRHEGDLIAIKNHVKEHGAPPQRIAWGVIDVKTPIVETPETVAMRLQLLADAGIDPDNITAGTDCGFETFMGFGNVSHRVAKEKLRSAA
ncbi:MAG: hypothetical protein ACE5IB_05905, partial [Candidatus Geothermarchaeales archaeon]